MRGKIFRPGVPEFHPESLMPAAGYEPGWSEGAVVPPIYLSTTYEPRTAQAAEKFFKALHGRINLAPKKIGLVYSRINNPNAEIDEDCLVVWEKGAGAGALFCSGMAAITTTLLTFLQPGDAIIHSDALYGGTDHFIKHDLAKLGIHSVVVGANKTFSDIEKIVAKRQLTDRIRIVYVETPGNPTNVLYDLELFSKVANHFSKPRRPVISIADNTFLGPMWQHPLRHGIDLALYSATKYISGHSDATVGAVLGSESLISEIKRKRIYMGTVAEPFSAWLVGRSLQTLGLRAERHLQNALRVADFLRFHPKVKQIYYPGLLAAGSKQHGIYKKQCLAPGAIISFELFGGKKSAFRFLNNLTARILVGGRCKKIRIIKLAVSLGSTEWLASHPATTTHMGVAQKDRKRLGISNGLIRLSVGVGDASDFITVIGNALRAA